MKPKPDFERLRKALLCEEPDRVPIVELHVDLEVMEAFLGRRIPLDGKILNIKDSIEFWCKAGYDFFPIQIFGAVDLGWEELTTPMRSDYSIYGDHQQEKFWAPEGSSVISDFEDFEKFPWPSPDSIDCSILDEVNKHLPEGMKIIPGIHLLFDLSYFLMGLEEFCVSTITQPDLVEAIVNRIGEIMLRTFEKTVQYDNVGAMWIADDIAYSENLFIKPEFFRKHIFPWYKKMGDICRDRDLPLIFHSDGKLWDVIDDLVDAGFNALHPIEPKAMDINEVKKRYCGKLCVIGNIDLGYTLTRGTPEEVVEETKRRIKDLAPGGGYCVGSSNTVTNYVPLENYKAMIDTVFKYGKYPIAF